MPQFCITYLGGKQPDNPEEGQKHFARYMKWLNGLGEAAVSPANPMKGTQTVHPDGSVTDGGNTAMSGFTIIEVDSMDDALAVAKDCPFLEMEGSLEVSELMQMPGMK